MNESEHSAGPTRPGDPDSEHDQPIEIAGAGDDRQTSRESDHSSTSDTGRWPLIVLVLLCVGGVGVGMTVVLGGEERDDGADGADESAEAEQPSGFEPYDGSGAPGQPADDGENPFAETSEEGTDEEKEETEEDDEPRLQDQMREAGMGGYGEDGFDDPRDREVDVVGKEPDGEDIIEDSRGNSVSAREAQNRVENRVESIENADKEWERRLRRRDTRLNSRVLESGEDGELEPVPGVELKDSLQDRISENFDQPDGAEDAEIVDEVESDN